VILSRGQAFVESFQFLHFNQHSIQLDTGSTVAHLQLTIQHDKESRDIILSNLDVQQIFQNKVRQWRKYIGILYQLFTENLDLCLKTQIQWGLVKNRSRFSVNNWYNIPMYFLHCLTLFWNICCTSKLLKIMSLLSLSCCIVSCKCATVDPVSSWIECWLKCKNWKDSTNACPRESITVSVELINYSQVQSAHIILCVFLHIFSCVFFTWIQCSILNPYKVLNVNCQTQMWQFSQKCENSVYNVALQSEMWQFSPKCDNPV
jgi:hypothetical protein